MIAAEVRVREVAELVKSFGNSLENDAKSLDDFRYAGKKFFPSYQVETDSISAFKVEAACRRRTGWLLWH